MAGAARTALAALALALLSAWLIVPGGPAAAQGRKEPEPPPYYLPSVNDLGGVGLLQTRTARFRPDGSLMVGASVVDPYRRYFVTFQPLPWLEATFRYTDVRNRLFSDVFAFSGDQSFKDRGADLKFRLLEEDKFWPQIAFGLQDGLGTGLFSSEYIVASKRYFDLDFHFGVAWGLLGNGGRFRNPLADISSRFVNREAAAGQGGEANINTFLSGETIGFFGGVEWYTPIDGLTLKLEYDGNDYQGEPLFNRFKVDSRWNAGFVYRPTAWFEVSAGYERGNTVMLRATLQDNLKTTGLPKFGDEPPEVTPRPPRPVAPAAAPDPRRGLPDPGAPERIAGPVPDAPPAAAGPMAAVDSLFEGLANKGFEVESVELNGTEARLILTGGLAGRPAAAIDGAAEWIAATLPVEIERVTLAEHRQDGQVQVVSLERGEIENRAIVDLLFDSLEAEGYAVESLDLSHTEATIVVADGPIDSDLADRRAAAALLQTLPAPVQRITIVRARAGVRLRQVVLARQDIQQQVRVDRLFDGLEARGFEVESFEISRRQATVRVSARIATVPPDYEAAARLIAESAPEPLDQVVLVGLTAGIEASRVLLRRNRIVSTDAAVGADDAVKPMVTQEYVPDLSDKQKQAFADAVFEDLAKEGFNVDAVHLTRFKATAFVTPTKFRQYARNVGRVTRVIANHAPHSVEEISVVTMSAGLETARVTTLRKDLEAALRGQSSVDEIWAHAVIEAPKPSLSPFGDKPEGTVWNARRYPSFDWRIRPALRQHIGGPDQFYLYQIWLALSGNVDLAPGLSVSGTVGRDIFNNFDKIRLVSESVLPHVRSDIASYLKEGENNLVKLEADYVFQPLRDVYARVSAGIFEEMFGGYSGEVLYRPFGSRLAVGVDVNKVRQRTFEQRFEFQDYRVITGHLNVYYKMPFHQLLGEFHTGQFLAGDRGTQFAMSRLFDSGIRIGAWATFTNVSAEDFGEGSFDKGFYISIPFELFLTSHTRRRGTFGFRPLTRDGGQRLGKSKQLYGLVESGNLDHIMHDWRTFLD